MGKKPLYTFQNRDRFFAASELQALLSLLPSAPTEDVDSTADYLRYGFFLPGSTIYQGVREILPGHWLTWSASEGARMQPYWRLSVGGFPGDVQDAAARLRETLEQAVRRRLVADVEVGGFLSGGVDSSLVVALAAKALGSPPKTFTIGFTEKSFDERRYAKQVARQFGTDHREKVLEDLEPSALARLVLQHVGQPFSDSSLLPTALLSRMASRHVKVALSGDGGDELFCGYQRYVGRTLLRWYTRLPVSLRRGAERLIRSFPEPTAHHSHSLLKKLHLFGDLSRRAGSDAPYVAPLLYDAQEFAALAPDLVGRGHAPPGIPPECDGDDVWRMMVADALVYLPQDILVKTDRASMAFSLEARAPFLDQDVVALAFSLPRSFHLPYLNGKRMLESAFRPLLPSWVWSRRKQGFAVPVHRWFEGALGDELKERVAAESGPFDASIIGAMLASHRAGLRDQGHRLWQLYAYCLWREVSGRESRKE
jgi:asparagine synthase (glutamine-hydrolysing)